MRLNLGCGPKKIEGFVNVDFAGDVDLVHDLTKPLPFEDGSADEIHAYHFFEHVHRWQADDILLNWVKVLKPEGLLVLELPCLDKIMAIYHHYASKKMPIDKRLTIWGLFGDPGYKNEAMMHKWCYSVGELSSMMRGAGLKVEMKEPQTHIAHRDMRLEGVKKSLVLV